MAEATQIIRLVIDSSKAVGGAADATRALEKLERSTASMDGALSRMEKGLASVGGMVKAQLALMVAELGARFLQMAKDSLSAAAGLDELAEQLGITTVGLQALQFSAVQNGVKLEQLETSISKFSQKMGEAAGGSKEMVEALTALGVKNLDVQGKLRPTEALLSEVAEAITKMEDPAKRSAAAVDFFGKAGARMLPMLKDISGGFDDMAEKARRSGAMISKEAIEKLEKLGDSAEIAGLRLRALFAENAAGPLTDILDFITRKMENVGKILSAAKGDWLAILALLAGGVPGLVGRAMAPTEKERVTSELADQRRRSTEAWTDLGDPKLSSRERPSAMSAYAAAQARIPQLEAQLNVLEVGGRAEYRPSDPDGIGINLPRVSKGASTSTVKGVGQGEADKYAKLIEQLKLAADAQDKMTAAARSGDVAFQDQEIKLKAAEKALGIYGQALDATDPRLQKIEELIRRDTMGKAAQSYVTATTEIEKQNEVLEAEIRLINATIPARAAEIALIKAKQDADKAGKALTPQDVDGRRVAIEQNERLKAQGEEIRKANELWTAPLKSALESIQRVGADAFEQMLTNGTFTFQSLGETFKKIVIRMAAEFMALATIRPVMTVLLNAVSPGMASTMGLGGGGGMSMPSMGGGGMPSMGGGGMPSMGGFGGGMSGFELPSFLGGGTIGELMAATPFASAAPAGGFASIEALMASGQAGSSAGLAAGGIQGAVQGLSVGSMMGAGLGIGMGAYSLATANGNTGKTLGGIGQMIGGVMMLIPGMQIPGMIVSVLASVLPGLLGGEEYKWAPLSGANTRFDPAAGGYTQSSTEQLGGKSIGGQFSSVKTAIDAIFKQTGGKLDPSKAFGGAVWNNQREGTTSTYIISPVVGSAQLSEAGGDPTKAVEAMIAKIFYNTATTEGALTGVSPTLTKALAGHEPTTLKEVDDVLSLVAAYDSLGKKVSPLVEVFKRIDAQFVALTDGANKYGLSLDPINAEKNAARKKIGDDMMQGYGDTVMGTNDPMRATLIGLRREHDAMITDASAAGTELGTFTEMVNAASNVYQTKLGKVTGDFIKGLTDQIANLNDPMAAQLDAIKAQRDANLTAAEAIRAVAGDTTALTTATALYGAQLGKLTGDFEKQITQGTLAITDPTRGRLTELAAQREQALASARALDTANGTAGRLTGQAEDYYRLQFNTFASDMMKGITGGLLAMNDPLGAQVAALHEARDAAMLSATAINEFASAMNGTFVDTLKITEFYAKQEAQIKEQFYAQSLSGLEALIKRLTFGDLAGASPTSMLAGTRGDYRATLSAAQSGDIKGLENLSGAADTYVQSARSYFASSPEYYAIVKEVKDAITAIDVNVRSGNITPGGATGGNSVDAGAWAGIVTSLQEMVSTQNQQIAVLREELGTTNALLRRQLLNA